MSDLVSIAEVWRERARVAEEAAAELDALVTDASLVVRRNHFGVDCAEGEALFGQLQQTIAGWRDAASQLCTDLGDMAANCGRAAQEYGDADAHGFG